MKLRAAWWLLLIITAAQELGGLNLAHSVAGLVKVDDSRLISDHHGQRVNDTLAANAAVSEALEWEVVWAP